MKTCRRGLHQFEGRTCPECKKATAAAWYARFKERDRPKKLKWYAENAAIEIGKRVEWGRDNPENGVWSNMRRRCNDPENEAYARYGGRGIVVCERWNDAITGYKDFLQDMGRRPSPKHTLDRRDNGGNYEPGNCWWTTYTRQNRNRRSSKMLTWNGKTQCVKDWAEELGLSYSTLVQRVGKCGWPAEKALTTPIMKAFGKQ